MINQFLAESTNTRTDGYGGSVANRCRFCLEVTKAVVAAVGAERVGIRVSPFNFFLYDAERGVGAAAAHARARGACGSTPRPCCCASVDAAHARARHRSATDSKPAELYGHLIPALSALKLSYIHLIAARQFEATPSDDPQQLAPFRKLFKGPAILAGGFERDTGAAAIAAGEGEAIAYGRHYLANPDLPKRYALGAELNAYDRDTFYNPMFPVKGYIDYPFLGQEATPEVAAVDPYAVKK